MTWQKPPVGNSADFTRIVQLPVRTDAEYPPDLVQQMTALLREPGGTETLFDVQARSLYDFGTCKSGFFPLSVGSGKTLISFLLPRVIAARTPILYVPGALVTKTEREWRAAMKHWQVAKHLRIRSYDKLSRVSGADQLDREKPDLLIFDECHKLKNPKSALTRRVTRYMEKNPQTIVCPLGGTIMKNSIRDFAHLLQWSHKSAAPIPFYAATLAEWAEALDEKVNPVSRRSPGVLTGLMPGLSVSQDETELTYARKAFFSRLNATRGVVSSSSKDGYDGSLYVTGTEYNVNQKTEDNFKLLRTEMKRPDGWALSEALQVWAVARLIALGLHYEWQPGAPQPWLDARKQWAAFVRDFLASKESEHLGIDSEFATMNAVLDGRVYDQYGILDEWRKIKPSFDINPVPVWHDDSALNFAANWLGSHPKGICWVEHVYFGKELARRTKLPYFGAKGLDSSERFIEDWDGPCIASSAANSTGRNLQKKWNEGLETAAAADAERWEQKIGRFHRNGQLEDEVAFDVMIGCREHLEAVPRARESSFVKRDLLGFKQKLQIADLTWPDMFELRDGWRWA